MPSPRQRRKRNDWGWTVSDKVTLSESAYKQLAEWETGKPNLVNLDEIVREQMDDRWRARLIHLIMQACDDSDLMRQAANDPMYDMMPEKK